MNSAIRCIIFFNRPKDSAHKKGNQKKAYLPFTGSNNNLRKSTTKY